MNLTGVVYNFTLKKYQSFKEYLKWKEKQNGIDSINRTSN